MKMENSTGKNIGKMENKMVSTVVGMKIDNFTGNNIGKMEEKSIVQIKIDN